MGGRFKNATLQNKAANGLEYVVVGAARQVRYLAAGHGLLLATGRRILKTEDTIFAVLVGKAGGNQVGCSIYQFG
jgi:hypothetical protein